MTTGVFDQAILAELRNNVGQSTLIALCSTLRDSFAAERNRLVVAIAATDIDIAHQTAHTLACLGKQFGAVRVARAADDLIKSGFEWSNVKGPAHTLLDTLAEVERIMSEGAIPPPASMWHTPEITSR